MIETRDLYAIISNRFQDVLTHYNIKRGGMVFAQDAMLDHLYLLRSGRLSLLRCTRNGQEVRFAEISMCDVLGAGALVADTPIGYCAVAAIQCEVACVPKATVLPFLTEPEMLKMLLCLQVQKTNQAWKQLEVMIERPMAEKIQSALVWLADSCGVQTHDGVVLPTTVAAIAKMIGVTRETVHRELSARPDTSHTLVVNGHKRQITIKDSKGW